MGRGPLVGDTAQPLRGLGLGDRGTDGDHRDRSVAGLGAVDVDADGCVVAPFPQGMADPAADQLAVQLHTEELTGGRVQPPQMEIQPAYPAFFDLHGREMPLAAQHLEQQGIGLGGTAVDLYVGRGRIGHDQHPRARARRQSGGHAPALP